MKFTLKTKINATAKEVYTAWLTSDSHSKMTGGMANITDKVGGNFDAWDGYIEGKNIILEPYMRIVQSWRTLEFKPNEVDSQIDILLNEVDGETELTLIHSNVPESGGHYIDGWDKSYFQPMKTYFLGI